MDFRYFYAYVTWSQKVLWKPEVSRVPEVKAETIVLIPEMKSWIDFRSFDAYVALSQKVLWKPEVNRVPEVKVETNFKFRKWNQESISNRLIPRLPEVRKLYENRKFVEYRKWGRNSVMSWKMKSAPKTM